MPHELEYIVKDALIMCDKGTAPASFTPTYNTSVKISGCLVSTKADKLPLVNIPCMGACSMLQGSPCNPTPTDWENTYKVKVKGQETLLYKSELPCSLGGKIKFITSGQVKIPPEEYDKLIEENSTENDSGLSWLDGVEMIPFIGGVVGMVRSATKDPTDWLGFGLSAVSLVADVAGLFSFGAGNGVSATIKAGKLGRVAIKATKVASKVGKASKLGKAGLKVVAKSLAKKVDDIALKTGKVCVFACFPKGTKIHTEKGFQDIENIRIGDLVWSWDETTNTKALKKVVSTTSTKTDVVVELHTINGKIVKTTPNHPFKTNTEWTDALDLKVGDVLKTFNDNNLKLSKIVHLPSDEEVYNFYVEDFNTYYVGDDLVLVHNACTPQVMVSLKNIYGAMGTSLKHIFSTKHIKGGILELGKNRKEILKSTIDKIKDINNKGLLKEGSNQIRTTMNGVEVEIRVFIKDSNVMSINIFKDYSPRNMGNIISK